jgi:integrase
VTNLLVSGSPVAQGAYNAPPADPEALTQAQTILRGMVVDSVTSVHSKRNYAKALDDLFAFAASRPLTRALLMEFRATMDALSPSTVNVRLSAVRKMVTEARKNGMIGAEEAANLTDVPNIPQKGTRLGNWLTREQAKELLAVPDRSTLKGKRDYVILAMLVGCALRRQELASLDVETIQLREGRWVLADLEGKGRRGPYRCDSGMGEAGNQRLDDRRRGGRREAAPGNLEEGQGEGEPERLGRLVGGRAVRQTDRNRAVRGA